MENRIGERGRREREGEELEEVVVKEEEMKGERVRVRVKVRVVFIIIITITLTTASLSFVRLKGDHRSTREGACSAVLSSKRNSSSVSAHRRRDSGMVEDHTIELGRQAAGGVW